MNSLLNQSGHGRITNMRELVFLKLGGSLITDKTQRYTPRLEKLAELAAEIRAALSKMPNMHLLLGHGSGSFGHYAVQEHLENKNYSQMESAETEGNRDYWHGFSEVWYRASELNRHVMQALHQANVPAVSLAPSANVRTTAGTIAIWDLAPMQAAIDSNLVPVVFGDIVFDDTHGGTVLSTEVLMMYLARRLQPQRILLAGLEAAVWADFPARQLPIAKITPLVYPSLEGKIGGSHGTDVTGGMKSKVDDMMRLVREIPNLTVKIFSAEEPGNLCKALGSTVSGTLIASD